MHRVEITQAGNGYWTIPHGDWINKQNTPIADRGFEGRQAYHGDQAFAAQRLDFRP